MILVALLGIVALSNQYQYAECGHHSAADQHKGSACASEYALSVDGVMQAAEAKPQTPWEVEREYEDLKAQRRMSQWAYLMVWVSGAGVLVTAIGVIYVASTLQATREATKAAQDAVAVTRFVGEKQAQAYLICNTGKLRLMRLVQAGQTEWWISCNLVVANKGQSPAHKIEIAYEAWLLKSTRPGSGEGFIDFSGETFSADVGPGDEEKAIISTDLFTKAEHDVFRKNELWVSIHGTLKWTNEFGNGQEQPFSLASPKFWNADFFVNSSYNDAKTIPMEGVGRRAYGAIGGKN